ncbi:MAG: response regulator [Proteobacteria bacterium]|nr:response regulator [Pseudomonadota bacterium]
MRKTQARLLDAIENLPVGFDLYDRDERLILFNEKVLIHENLRTQQRFGMPSEDVGLMVARSGFIPDAVGREEEWAQQRLSDFRSDTPTTFKTSEGRSILVENKRTSEGGRVVIRIDLTELLGLQEQLRNSQKLEALGQLTSGIAHEFNNMLQAISGYLEFLNAAFSEDEKNSQLVGRALRVVQGGASLTQSLLAYVGKGPLEAQVTDIGYLLSDITKLLRPTLGETIQIETKLDGQVWPVKIDPGQLQAAIINLATNSRDAMPDGGTLSIEVKNVTLDGVKPRLRFYQARNGDYVSISVTDTGTGMPKAILEQATDPFFTTKEIGSGTGLGLSMVDGFIHRQSGGFVDIDSTPGQGTIITLLLPRADEVVESVNPTVVAAHSVTEGNHRILLVEDDAAVLDALKQSLESSGYAVHTATDADEAQQLFQNGFSVDLLLTDIVIPGKLTGADLAQEICAKNPDIKVVLMTGYAERDIVARGIGTSGYRLLRKPVGMEKLLGTLTEVLHAPPP